MRRQRAVIAALLLTLCLATAADAAVAVEGIDRASILPPAGAEVVSYRNAGYRLEIVDGLARIEVDATPLLSSAPFVLPKRADRDSVAQLARAVTTGAETQFAAVSKILSWVVANIEYRLDRRLPQQAEAVLARRSGYCTGLARLTVALLETVGIPAREVAGYVVASGEQGAPSGYHRWVEVYLEDRGWVFSDPLRSHHYVPATYLRLASDSVAVAAGLEGLLLERRDGVEAVDLYPAAAADITARRSSARRLAAAVSVAVEAPDAQGWATLASGNERRRRQLIAGRASFLGLQAGVYRLRLDLDGHVTTERVLELRPLMHTAIFLPAPRLASGGAFSERSLE